MKNFKKVVFGLLAMLVMVTGVSAATQDTYVGPVSGTNITNGLDLAVCLTATKNGDCYLTKNITEAQSFIVTGNVKIDLRGHKLSTQSITVNTGASLEIIGGELEFARFSNLMVSGSLTINGTKISVDTGASAAIEVSSTKGENIVLNNVTINGNHGAINVNGNAKVEVSNSTVDVDGVAIIAGGTPEITLNGNTITSDNSVYNATSGTPKLVINGGSYETTGNFWAINVKAGEVTLKDGTITDNKGAAAIKLDGQVKLVVPENSKAVVNAKGIAIDASNASSAAVAASLDINGGTFNSTDSYALNLNTSSNDVVITGGKFITENATVAVYTAKAPRGVTGGVYVSTNLDTTKTYLDNVTKAGYSAVKFGKAVYVGKAHELTIEMPDRTNAKSVEIHSTQTLLAGQEYKFDDEAVKAFLNVIAAEGYQVKYVLSTDDEHKTEVTGDSFTMPDEDAVLTVSIVKAEEQKPADEQQPSNTPSSGANDGEDVKPNENTNTNPSTFDGIASIVTMAVSSLGAAGYSIKKIIRK